MSVWELTFIYPEEHMVELYVDNCYGMAFIDNLSFKEHEQIHIGEASLLCSQSLWRGL